MRVRECGINQLKVVLNKLSKRSVNNMNASSDAMRYLYLGTAKKKSSTIFNQIGNWYNENIMNPVEKQISNAYNSFRETKIGSVTVGTIKQVMKKTGIMPWLNV